MNKFFVCLPVLNEYENIEKIVRYIEDQDYTNWELIICVNQPHDWWNNKEKLHICVNNTKTIKWLNNYNSSKITIIDRSSFGVGWNKKHYGVGWARKVTMDFALTKANKNDFIISIDADTCYSANYLSSIINVFDKNPTSIGFSAPYFHLLTDDFQANKAILRYEIYMRSYNINMLLINNPYSFTAIGSGMGCKAHIYKQIGGITPKLSGEDFYFIQKLRKMGQVITNGISTIFPQARFSDRVFFGTGPAMIKGRIGNWNSYPIYNKKLFDNIQKTYLLFDKLFENDINTPLDNFIFETLKEEKLWEKLRNNTSSAKTFQLAATQRIDALRILQYLKTNNKTSDRNNIKNLIILLKSLNAPADLINIIDKYDKIENIDIEILNKVRILLFEKEKELTEKKCKND